MAENRLQPADIPGENRGNNRPGPGARYPGTYFSRLDTVEYCGRQEELPSVREILESVVGVERRPDFVYE